MKTSLSLFRQFPISALACLRLTAWSIAGFLSLNASVWAQSYAITAFPSYETGTGGAVSGAFVQAPDGNFYAASSGGSLGMIVRLTPEGVPSPVYTFTPLDANGMNADGGGPGPLMLSSDGNLYGIAAQGGSMSGGTVFQVTTSGQFKTLASLDPAVVGGGFHGPLVQSRAGILYGVSAGGGPGGSGANGTVFSVTLAGQVSLVHAFTALDQQTGTNYDGASTITGLAIDGLDNYYGTTSLGGANGSGTVFMGNSGSFATVYSFPTVHTIGAPGYTAAAITGDGAGLIFGAAAGLVSEFQPVDFIFKLTGGVPQTLYTFSADQASDGAGISGLTLGGDGNLYGATVYGGANNQGTIFMVTPGGSFTKLHDFGANELATGAPVLGNNGNLYGGAYLDNGPYYELTSTLVPVFTSASAVTLALDAPLRYQVAATNGPTSYAASGLPAGLAFDPTTGLLTGIPTATGEYFVQLSAENAEGTGYLTLTLTVAPPSPDAPVIQVPATPLTAAVGQPFHYQLDATNKPTSYQIAGLPPGVTLDPKTGLVHGIFANAGKILLQLQAQNASGVGSANLEIDVTAAANVPTVTVVGSNPDADAKTGQVGDFTLTLGTAPATDLVVAYTVKGSAVPGVDYQMLKGTVKIKAGKTSKNIKVVPAGDLGGAVKKVVKLTLQPGTGYTVGTPGPVKVKIVNP